MGRATPKIVVLAGIGLVVLAIYWMQREAPAPQQPGVVYINPNVGSPPSP